MKGVKINQFSRFLQRQIINRPIATFISILITVYFFCVVIIMICEETSLGTAASMVMPAFLGELGIVESRSILTQGSIMLALLVSIVFLALVTAKITSMFIEFCRRGGIIVSKVNTSDHIVICGWNFQGEKIVKELINSEAKPHREIVVLANCEVRPVKDERVQFIKGDPTQDEALIRAGIKRANSAIVLSDLTKPANEADSEALMIVLALESLHRDIHSCVQIVSSTNRIHFERAHADEIICLDQVGGNLVVASALNHGTSRVVTELLTFDSGSEFYRYEAPLSEQLVRKEFSEAVTILAQRRIILLGVETNCSDELRKKLHNDILHSVGPEDNRVIVVNPQDEYRIQQGDVLFLIAESAPIKL